jgi:signal transduction histidine kinase
LLDRPELDHMTAGERAAAGPTRTERQTSRLLDAVQAIGAELDLDVVLRQIVLAAMDLVDARYGALGVMSQDGVRLDRLVHVGMDDRTVAAIGALPTFCGVLGLIVDETVRTADIGEHPRAEGFPLGHPRMRSFLGVPLRVRDAVFGNLYLAEKTTGPEFTAEDEEVAAALAGAAGTAVQRARLYEQTRQRESWLHAGSEVTKLLLSGAPEAEVFTSIAEHVRELTGATEASVMLPEPDGRIRVAAGVGPVGVAAVGLLIDPDVHAVGEAFRTGRTINLAEGEMARERLGQPHLPQVGPALMVPMAAGGSIRGVLGAARPPGAPPFSPSVLPAVQGFAEQAELAYELAERRRDGERLSLFADRDRIARNLHDLVIQRLFATGMGLEGAANLISVDPVDAAARVRRAVDDLDITIKEIRTTVFALQQPVGHSYSLRAKIIDVADEAANALGFTPSVQFEGLVDTTVDDRIGEELLAVLREALSNVARHAAATSASVAVSASGRLLLVVTDDGLGLSDSTRRSGLANMAIRAEQLGGSFTVARGDPVGTVLRWSVPLRA